MLAWIPVVIVMGFLGGCAIVITTSCYQVIKSISKIKMPKNRGPLPRTIEI
ncbi:hypothetical protein [Desulfosporosinus fructosivorans]